MTVNRKTNTVSMEAAADLSTAQHRIVFVDDDGRVNVNSSTATVCLGILLNKPAALGRAALVAIEGSIVKCEAGAAVNERDKICAVAGGRGSAITTENAEVVGVAISAAAGSGQLFELEINPQNV
jgi:Uncharacterized conserved protein (DUF2190)